MLPTVVSTVDGLALRKGSTGGLLGRGGSPRFERVLEK
jgi:hypothetical protein